MWVKLSPVAAADSTKIPPLPPLGGSCNKELPPKGGSHTERIKSVPTIWSLIGCPPGHDRLPRRAPCHRTGGRVVVHRWPSGSLHPCGLNAHTRWTVRTDSAVSQHRVAR